ncbi:hypothetical protein RDWZM_002173 [Blomia tropicalis]|uniref:Methyltransferase domain-containing protein n=1 Tax=Blomia tropicalis TaxID=40697 RepID=A0A9Q0RPN8_BLOTA|nr:hypothetical protein RDWZM_002173 [Blomia tropicalis]
MNLFEISEDQYVSKSKLRVRDASMLAYKIGAEFLNSNDERGGVILDVGCGTGQSTLELAIRFQEFRVIGIDSNPAYIEHAPAMTKNVEFYCVDISEIGNFSNFCTITELTEGSVSIVISTYWLSSLNGISRTQTITAIQTLLRPDGYLYILDLVWTDAYAVIYQMNQSEQWKQLIKNVDPTDHTAMINKITLPESDHPPSNEQVSKQWIEQFEPFDQLELFQIVRNKLFYRFQSMEDMMHILESVCITQPYLTEHNWNEYFLEYVRQTFDQYFLASNNLKLGYVNLLVVAHKKTSVELQLQSNENQPDKQERLPKTETVDETEIVSKDSKTSID